ncbi:MAG: hypothetical protein J7494_10550 [Sphingobium sp.]|nr:hypothetical protein [Sphingobium sp.]
MSLDFDLMDGTVDAGLSADDLLPENPKRPLWKTVLWTLLVTLLVPPLAIFGLFAFFWMVS